MNKFKRYSGFKRLLLMTLTATTVLTSSPVTGPVLVEAKVESTFPNPEVGKKDNVKTEKNEESVVNRFEQTLEKVLSAENLENVKEAVVKDMKNAILFLANEKAIQGLYFRDLTTTAKKQVMALFSYADEQLEEKWPHYKKLIVEKSKPARKWVNSQYDKVKEKGLDFLDSIGFDHDKREETASDFKEGAINLKKSFQNAFDLMKKGGKVVWKKVKPTIKEAGESLKEGIQKIKNKLVNWAKK